MVRWVRVGVVGMVGASVGVVGVSVVGEVGVSVGEVAVGTGWAWWVWVRTHS